MPVLRARCTLDECVSALVIFLSVVDGQSSSVVRVSYTWANSLYIMIIRAHHGIGKNYMYGRSFITSNWLKIKRNTDVLLQYISVCIASPHKSGWTKSVGDAAAPTIWVQKTFPNQVQWMYNFPGNVMNRNTSALPSVRSHFMHSMDKCNLIAWRCFEVAKLFIRM